jgi:hypothetical protein
VGGAPPGNEVRTMRSIGIVSCFFGTWPKWIDFFLVSCRHNPSVDFLLVTDCGPLRQELAANVKLIELDLPLLQALASERLGLAAALSRPYKVIDLRPSWGVVFAEILQPYDFWGYCDLDLIFGDIRSFFTEEVLAEYDVISTRREFLSGPCTLFRNDAGVNRLYERSHDYRKVFTSDSIFNFEECGWRLHNKLLKGAAFAEVAAQARVDSMMHVLARSPDIRVRYDTVGGEWFSPYQFPGSRMYTLRWQQGKLLNVDDDIALMYFHLMYPKHRRRLYIPPWKELPEVFFIGARGFYWNGQEGWGQRLATRFRRGLYFAGRLGWVTYRWLAGWYWRIAGLEAMMKSIGRY